MNIIIKPSNKPDKKYDAIIDGKKTISFGQAGASDFTKHKNEERKNRYIDRHKKNENWNDPKTAGFYSRWITWNKPTITESIKDTNRRFKNINIKLR
jgi:hypothetical protein